METFLSWFLVSKWLGFSLIEFLILVSFLLMFLLLLRFLSLAEGVLLLSLTEGIFLLSLAEEILLLSLTKRIFLLSLAEWVLFRFMAKRLFLFSLTERVFLLSPISLISSHIILLIEGLLRILTHPLALIIQLVDLAVRFERKGITHGPVHLLVEILLRRIMLWVIPIRTLKLVLHLGLRIQVVFLIVEILLREVDVVGVLHDVILVKLVDSLIKVELSFPLLFPRKNGEGSEVPVLPLELSVVLGVVEHHVQQFCHLVLFGQIIALLVGSLDVVVEVGVVCPGEGVVEGFQATPLDDLLLPDWNSVQFQVLVSLLIDFSLHL